MDLKEGWGTSLQLAQLACSHLLDCRKWLLLLLPCTPQGPFPGARCLPGSFWSGGQRPLLELVSRSHCQLSCPTGCGQEGAGQRTSGQAWLMAGPPGDMPSLVKRVCISSQTCIIDWLHFLRHHVTGVFVYQQKLVFRLNCVAGKHDTMNIIENVNGTRLPRNSLKCGNPSITLRRTHLAFIS